MSRKKKRVRMKNYSELVSKLRKDSGETQADFAKKLGVTQPMVSAWEIGAEDPSPTFCIRLGNLAHYPDDVWFWQQAGLDEQEILRAAEKVLTERATARVVAGTIEVRCVEKTAEGIKLLDRLFPVRAEFMPNPLSTVCLIVGENAATPGISAGDHIVLDESMKNARDLNPFRERVILAESSVPVPGSGKKGTFGVKFGTLYMGRLQFKPSPPVCPDERGLYSMDWFAVLDARETSFTWRPGDAGTAIGHSPFLSPKLPEVEREEKRFQDAARRQAFSEMRPFDNIKILGEVIAWFRAPAAKAKE